jgi:hypothetical protein
MRAGHWLWTRGWLLTATMAPAIAWAQEPDVCERLGAAEAERSRCAREHYGAREYVTAARIFEELWRNTGAAKYLYNAAAAREAAGSDARALAHWLRYAAISEPSSTEQAEAEGRMSKLRARLITTTIEVTPAAALGPEAALSFERDLGGEVETFDYPVGLLSGAQPGVFTVHLEPGTWRLRVVPDSPVPAYNVEHASHSAALVVGAIATTLHVALVPEHADLVLRFSPPDVLGRGIDVTLRDPLGTEAPLERRARTGELRLSLRTGPWTYSVKPRRHWALAQTGELAVEPGAALDLRWDLEDVDVAALPREERRRVRLLTLGLGLAGGATVSLGIGLLAAGAGGLDEHSVPGSDLLYYRQDDASRSLTLTAWGAGNTGAAIGLGVSAALEALGPTRRRHYVQLGVGSGAALVGLLWHVIGYATAKTDYAGKQPRGCSDSGDEPCVRADRVSRERVPLALSAGLLGAGVGLLAGVASSYLVRVKKTSGRNRPRVGAILRPQALGLTLHGSF